MILPLGFRYASTYAGIRKTKQDDLALILSDSTASAAGVFTRNCVQAAPVKLSKANLKQSGGMARAVLINAGNANCATRTGDRVALTCCRALSRLGKIPVTQILPASTGVIGVELNARLIVNALPRLLESLSEDGFAAVSRAILTTDTRPKTASAELSTASGIVRLAGMTKGAGMIHPLMATTLGFVMTDAAISPARLRPLLRRAVESSYNRLSVDGDTSTNDTVLVLANGASGVKLGTKDLPYFEQTLTRLLQELACQIARDGEGARKLIVIDVEGSRTEAEAARLARSIANSPLVKTAVAGADPNWGRILSAAGNAGVPFDPARVDVYLQGISVCRNGLAAPFSEPQLKARLEEPEVRILLRIRGKGKAKARFWTCDLTEDYIRINASYRT